MSSANSSSSSNGRRQNKKQLQRRIFLQTMRNVYPNSLEIRYEWSSDEKRFLLKPLSVMEKFSNKNISDKVWGELMMQLNMIFVRHVSHRDRIMMTVWALWLFSAVIYVAIGIVVIPQASSNSWYLVIGPLFLLISIVLVPNLCFTYMAMKPLLRAFEAWKHEVILSFDKQGVEAVKITSGELMGSCNATTTTSTSTSGPSLIKRILGTVYYGSNVWFRFEDAQVEIFWRCIKNGKHVRRYSLIITSSSHDNETTVETPRSVPKLMTINDVTDIQDEDEQF